MNTQVFPTFEELHKAWVQSFKMTYLCLPWRSEGNNLYICTIYAMSQHKSRVTAISKMYQPPSPQVTNSQKCRTSTIIRQQPSTRQYSWTGTPFSRHLSILPHALLSQNVNNIHVNNWRWSPSCLASRWGGGYAQQARARHTRRPCWPTAQQHFRRAALVKAMKFSYEILWSYFLSGKVYHRSIKSKIKYDQRSITILIFLWIQPKFDLSLAACIQVSLIEISAPK